MRCVRGGCTPRWRVRRELVDFRSEMRSEFDGLVARQLVADVPLAFGGAGLVLAATKLT